MSEKNPRHPRARRRRRALGLAFLAASLTACTEERPANRGQEDAERALRSLAYVSSTRVDASLRDRIGTLVHDRSSVEPGVQLLTEIERIRLLRLDGTVARSVGKEDLEAGSFSEAEPAPNGDFLVIDSDRAVLRLDRDWRPIWRTAVPAHHDVTTFDDSIYVVTRRLESVAPPPRAGPGPPVTLLVDSITRLSAGGAIEEEWPLYEIAGSHITGEQLQRARAWLAENGDPLDGEAGRSLFDADGRTTLRHTPLDIFHVNYVDIAERDIPGVCLRGDALVSFRQQDLIAFIRLDERRIVWSWGTGTLEGQHQPTIQPNGNILLFDNGTRRKWSRVIELDPRVPEIVWVYPPAPRRDFFSSWGGTAQKLKNGNVVITESEKGHLLEVTADRRLVWDYWQEFIDPERQRRRTILRSHRVAVEEQ